MKAPSNKKIVWDTINRLDFAIDSLEGRVDQQGLRLAKLENAAKPMQPLDESNAKILDRNMEIMKLKKTIAGLQDTERDRVEEGLREEVEYWMRVAKELRRKLDLYES